MSNTNNLISNIKHGMRNRPEPTVGAGVTICVGIDRYVGTITRLIDKNLFVYTQDDVKAAPNAGGIGHQNWICTPNPNAGEEVAKRSRNGKWYRATKNENGKWSVNAKNGIPILVGEKDYFHDWSF